MAPKSLSQTGFYPIKGIQAGLDPKTTNPLRKVPQRMDFDTWFTSQELVHINQRALFFPAFKNFCQAKPDDKFSFFQIAGIHGQPYVPWDEDGKRKGGNYCTHGVTTFTTWHRPYLLLFEQVIYEYMKDYATANYKGKELEDMLKAADQWRLPFWDWAAKKADPADKKGRWDYNIPLVFQDAQKKVEIRLPQPQGSGKVDNALYQFTMPGGLAMGDQKLPPALRIIPSENRDAQGRLNFTTPYHLTKGTSRHPAEVGITQGWVNGTQNNEKLVATLRNVSFGAPRGVRAGSVTESLRDAYFRLFTIEKFEDFASTRPSSSGVYHNCESLHNGMHGWCGGPAHGHAQDAGRNAQQGHMSVVAVAAFDPLFWFHHCNIDRTIAIWQALHPNSWFSPANRAEESDPLRPFHKDTAGTYWTSLDARETVPLGYTYPLLDRTAHLTPSGTYDAPAHQRAIITSLTDTYNAARSAAEKAALTADSPTGPGLRLAPLSALLAAAPEPQPADRVVPDYAVNVLYEKMALAGRQFTVHVFVGRVPPRTPFDFNDPEGSLVGEVFNFTAPAPTPTDAHASVDAGAAAGCANCARQAEEHARATGRVVLTNALITRWKQRLVHTPREGFETVGPKVLEGMEPELVVPFLKANLRWRVSTADDGKLVEDIQGAVPSVKVAVVVGKAQHFADGGKLSRFWDYRPAYEVTRGRPGGVDESDGLYPVGGEWRPGV